MADLVWVDTPDCSGGATGHPFKFNDKHEWRDAPEAPPPMCTDHDPPYRPAWVPYRTCSFCGSMHPEGLLRVLNDDASCSLSVQEHMERLRAGPLVSVQERMPPITLEWADFKYGYPHKLYVHHNDGSRAWGKFYTKHLFELPDATFAAVAVQLAAKTRIFFARDAKGTKWQRLGVDKAPS